MDKYLLKNQWRHLKEDAQNYWDNFSHDEIEQVNGDWYKLVRKLQEKYGYSRIEAEKEIEYFMSDVEDYFDEDEYRKEYVREEAY